MGKVVLLGLGAGKQRAMRVYGLAASYQQLSRSGSHRRGRLLLCADGAVLAKLPGPPLSPWTPSGMDSGYVMTSTVVPPGQHIMRRSAMPAVRVCPPTTVVSVSWPFVPQIVRAGVDIALHELPL